jgi:hypothetical protein
VEETKIETHGRAARKKKPGRRNSRSIINLFNSWGCFKNVGNGRMSTGTGLKVVGTNYVMIVPAKAEHTWQVVWKRVGFLEVDQIRKVREDRPVSFKEVIEGLPEDLRVKFEENIDLFLVPRPQR